MSDVERSTLFSRRHPHFTPAWLSQKLASHIDAGFSGVVIDPACGSGNLLIASALKLSASQSASAVRFQGIDISLRAVRECESALLSLVSPAKIDVRRGNFLTEPTSVEKPSVVIMNPPFRGYGKIPKTTRRTIAEKIEMPGRYNLSYAFVRHAVAVYQPEKLISLLPSNWLYSRGSSFRAQLDQMHGVWDWEEVEENAFPGLNVDVGILLWQPTRAPTTASRDRQPSRSEPSTVEVRHGTATGCDSAFFELAQSPPEGGFVMKAVRGRDVGRATARDIWVPSAGLKTKVGRFTTQAPASIVTRLRSRTCVRDQRRLLFEYHDPITSWFIGQPKLIVPEIVSGSVRVDLDGSGTRLPLHSTLAIRVASVEEGKSLRAFLTTETERRKLAKNAPKLSGGTMRLQVGALREAVDRWLKTRAPN